MRETIGAGPQALGMRYVKKIYVCWFKMQKLWIYAHSSLVIFCEVAMISTVVLRINHATFDRSVFPEFRPRR